MSHNALPVIGGSLVLLGLAVAAGFFGGSLASDPAARPTAPRSVPTSLSNDRSDENERRLDNFEERLRIAEDTANAAMQRTTEIDDLRREVAEIRRALRDGATLAADEPNAGDGASETAAEGPITNEERDKREAAQRDRLITYLHNQAGKNAHALIRQRLVMLGDATKDGAASRHSQVVSEARQMAVLYRLKPGEEQTLRGILTEEMASAVQEVAPYVAGGLSRTDFAQVQSKLGPIWDRRDERMREVLTEDDHKSYMDSQKEWRKLYDKALSTMEEDRTDGR